LPVGLHLVAPHWGEETLLRCAYQYEQLTDWHTVCPEDFS
jgi:aspartyl-tRNA(Asn)/glutamyl-tRNA(Gln) amidotransferase subunit A